MTLMTFVTGGLAFWIPRYLQHRDNPAEQPNAIFG